MGEETPCSQEERGEGDNTEDWSDDSEDDLQFEGCFVDEGVVEDERDDTAGEEDGRDLEGDGELVLTRIEGDAGDGLFLGRVAGAG